MSTSWPHKKIGSNASAQRDCRCSGRSLDKSALQNTWDNRVQVARTLAAPSPQLPSPSAPHMFQGDSQPQAARGPSCRPPGKVAICAWCCRSALPVSCPLQTPQGIRGRTTQRQKEDSAAAPLSKAGICCQQLECTGLTCSSLHRHLESKIRGHCLIEPASGRGAHGMRNLQVCLKHWLTSVKARDTVEGALGISAPEPVGCFGACRLCP